MIIRKLDRNTYDVFGGQGWPVADAVPYASNAQWGQYGPHGWQQPQWTRIRRFHWGMKQIAGTFLPRQLLHNVITAINQHPHGSLDNI